MKLDFLLKRGEFAPILRRFFINTLFDSTFMQIGIIIGSALFVAGTYMGRLGRKNPYLKGLRMVLFGAVAFVIGFAIQRLI